jgi:hypothetical protein
MIELKELLDGYLDEAKSIGKALDVSPVYLLARLRSKGIYPETRKNRLLLRTPSNYMFRVAFAAAFSPNRHRPAKLARKYGEDPYRTVLSLLRNYKNRFEIE